MSVESVNAVATFTLALALARLALVAGAALEPAPLAEVDNSVDTGPALAEDVVYQTFSAKCASLYSPSCLKLDLARLVDRLSGSPAAFALLPGVSLAARPGALTPSPSAARTLDDLLRAKVGRYLRSLTVSVRLAEAARAVAPHQAGAGDEGMLYFCIVMGLVCGIKAAVLFLTFFQ